MRRRLYPLCACFGRQSYGAAAAVTVFVRHQAALPHEIGGVGDDWESVRWESVLQGKIEAPGALKSTPVPAAPMLPPPRSSVIVRVSAIFLMSTINAGST